MMKSEFIDLLFDMHEDDYLVPNISEEDFRTIETVYTYYPKFGDKYEAASLYDTYGINIFKDMLPRARNIMRLTERVEKIRKELEETEKALKEAMSWDIL